MNYRPEIDGLRAVAVLAVVMNHARFEMFSGGFVGVDVFFVISGFLICDIITRKLDQGTFSIVDFYEKRARRIAPALVPVLVMTLIFGYYTMLPDPFDNLAQSVIATIFFGNNILLAKTSGYWDLASHFKPLLHTWSLGVEEQFYLVFPIIALFGSLLKPHGVTAVLVVIIIVSFTFSVLLTPSQPDASFYLIHTRAWEIGLGGLFSLLYRKTAPSAATRNVISLIGFMMVLLSIFTYGNSKMLFPYYTAALPVIGSGLVLAFAQPGTIVAKTLSLRPVVFIGLISYSLYLWHQPLFVFGRIMSYEELSPLKYLVLTVISIFAAYLSWKFVEQPFRKPKSFDRAAIFGMTAISSIIIASISFYIYRSNGIPNRIADLGIGPSRYIAYNERVFKYKLDAPSGAAKDVLLVIGNSTARDFVNVAIESGRFQGYQIIYRDDLKLCGDLAAQDHSELLKDATALVVSGELYTENCKKINLDSPLIKNKPFILLGVKHFGYNLNPYIFLSLEERPLARAHPISETAKINERMRQRVSKEYFYDFPEILEQLFGGVPIFDGNGHILSADRVHLTEAGAKFFSDFMFDDPHWKRFNLSNQKVSKISD